MINRLEQVKATTAANAGIIFAFAISVAIILINTWLLQFELAEKPAGVTMFYKWQLAEPTFWSQATAWLGFAFHTLGVWATIYWATEYGKRKYSDKLRPFNIAALAVNAVFILLHFAQTAIFYDGLAQDVPSWTAQGTVIMMLFVILALENRRRGMFFGKKLSFRQEFYGWIKRYHSYAFSFAVIYTFWFHPMVFTWGHLLGFIHVILVMLQGSLMYTRLHLNKKWIVILELLVLPHAAIVAVEQGLGLVPMFAFGFMAIFFTTQIYGLDYPRWMRLSLQWGFLITMFFVYTVLRQPFMANEIIRIPVIEYGLVFITYAGWWVWMRATGGFEKAQQEREQRRLNRQQTASGD